MTARFRALDAAFAAALRRWDARAQGEPVYGWGVKSIGAAVIAPAYGAVWLHVQGSLEAMTDMRLWEGERAAGSLGAAGVAKPALIDLHEWRGDALRYRATLHALAPSPAISRRQHLDRAPALDDAWWRDLGRSLEALAAAPTEREAVTEAAVHRRMREAYGSSVDWRVRRWETAHADLHWSNLTAPTLAILDWETWGRAPAGFDAAYLLATATAFPDVQERIRAEFADVLESRDGKLAVALVCAELARNVLIYGDSPLRYDSLRALGAQAAHALAP